MVWRNRRLSSKIFEDSQRILRTAKGRPPDQERTSCKDYSKARPPGASLPGPIENLHVEEWDRIRGYFENVSHHNASAKAEGFELWLSTLERFLLDRFVPRTFEDHAK